MKVGEFGLAEDMYGTGYVREDSKTVKIPYKWMPPESLEYGLSFYRTERCGQIMLKLHVY